MKHRTFYSQVVRWLIIIVTSVLFSRLSSGAWVAVMSLAGGVWALTGKVGKSLSMYLLITFLVIMNPVLMPFGGFFSIFVRFGPLIIGLALSLKGVGIHGKVRFPLGILGVYLVVAIISSTSGWAPLVSYLKIFNYLIFISAFWFGLHTLSVDPVGIYDLRAMIMALSVFVIGGSALLIPFPAISTLSGYALAMREGNLAAANQAMANIDDMAPLFCGITRQSQALGPILSAIITWVIADMLFVVKKSNPLHIMLTLAGFMLLYMTRSRAGFFAMLTGILMLTSYLPSKMGRSTKLKKNMQSSMWLILSFILIAACVSEIRSSSMSRWLRKTDDVRKDDRTLTEAVTASRQGLIESSMYDFRLNPLFGKGFQVTQETAEMVRQAGTGFVISAPIEKGVLPIMVLGETGIVGALVFVAFLVSFYTTIARNRLYITVTLFTVLLATNMAEATFFSPGGMGGVLWAICVIGGYCIDVLIAQQRFYIGMLKSSDRME